MTIPRPRILVENFVFPEALRWHDDRLWFVDMFGSKVMSTGMDGQATVIAEFDDRTSGIGFLADARHTPIVVLMDGKQLARLEADGTRLHIDLGAERGLYLNDMVTDIHGRAYVDCDVHLPIDHPDAPADRIFLVLPDGSYSVAAAGDLHGPNGLAITPDGRTLIVAEGPKARLTAFTIEPDGSLIDRRLFADTSPYRPDGICLDAEGAVWFGSSSTGRFVRIREGGQVVQTVDVDERWAIACVLGGEGRATLLMGTAAVPPVLRDGGSRRLPLADVVATLRGSHGFIEALEVEVPGAGIP